MLVEANLKTTLIALGVKTTNVVKQLTEGDAVAIYEGERDPENDAQVMERYEQAVEACRVWLRAVVGTQVIANQSDDICVDAELLMPDRLVEVAVYSAQYPFGGGCNADIVEKLHTPIGNFGYQVYRAKRMEETIDVKGIETEDFPKTLGDLAKTDHLFYRFSQSSPGRSEEKVFAQYIPGQITEAKDNEKYLSFVTEKTIASCFMYGDMITRLNFNLDDEAFKKIANTPIKYIGNALGEYESKYLLVEQNYSLRDITTIEMLFELVQNSSQLNSLFYFNYGSLDQRLHESMLSYAESIRNSYNEEKQQMLMEIVDYLDSAFENKNKFLRKNNVPIVIVMSKIALENNVKPELFKAFINDFANALYPAYEEASGSGNIKIVNVNQRLKVMFVAMCNYFGWDIDNVGKHFESEEAWTWDAITSENSEVNDDTASTDEDSPAMGSFINEPTEETVDTEDMDTEGDDAEEVVDEAV